MKNDINKMKLRKGVFINFNDNKGGDKYFFPTIYLHLPSFGI